MILNSAFEIPLHKSTIVSGSLTRADGSRGADLLHVILVFTHSSIELARFNARPRRHTKSNHTKSVNRLNLERRESSSVSKGTAQARENKSAHYLRTRPFCKKNYSGISVRKACNRD